MSRRQTRRSPRRLSRAGLLKVVAREMRLLIRHLFWRRDNANESWATRSTAEKLNKATYRRAYIAKYENGDDRWLVLNCFKSWCVFHQIKMTACRAIKVYCAKVKRRRNCPMTGKGWRGLTVINRPSLLSGILMPRLMKSGASDFMRVDGVTCMARDVKKRKYVQILIIATAALIIIRRGNFRP